MHKVFSDNMDEVGQRLKKLRRALQYTQMEMAHVLDISVSHYSKLEVGIGCLGNKLMRLLSRKYNVSREWLATGEGEEPDFTHLKPKILSRSGHTHRYVKKADDNIEKIVGLAYSPDIVHAAETIVRTTGITLCKAISLLVRQILESSSGVKAHKDETEKLAESGDYT